MNEKFLIVLARAKFLDYFDLEVTNFALNIEQTWKFNLKYYFPNGRIGKYLFDNHG
jgi:hypothetical protein